MAASARKSGKVAVRLGLALVVLAVIAVLGWFAYGALAADLRQQGAESLRQSILGSAKQCFAIEGVYPASVSYLEDNYGLSINRDDYQVNYMVFAENVLPSVSVVPR